MKTEIITMLIKILIKAIVEIVAELEKYRKDTEEALKHAEADIRLAQLCREHYKGMNEKEIIEELC